MFLSSIVKGAGRSTVAGLFTARAKSKPQHPAITFGDKSISYRELDERSNRLADVLKRRGCGVGDRIAVYARNAPEHLEVQLAAAKTGVIVAAQNWRLGRDELLHCIKLVTPKLIFVQEDLLENLNAVSALKVETLVMADAYEAEVAAASAEPFATDLDPEAGLVILYTSGTTGMPKGALISHRAMVARSATFTSDLSLPAAIDFIAWAPLYHMASMDHSLSTLMRGGTVHVVDGYEPKTLIGLIERYAIGWFVLMPGMISDFTAICNVHKPKVKNIVACGAMADLVPVEQIAAVTTVLNTPYLNTFGATETGLPPATGNTIPVGVAPRHLPKVQSTFCEVRLVDENDNDVPTGEPGEVAVRGPTVFSGYWNAEETNAHDFRNGWFHMGDVMKRNEDGTLEYVDRLKYMIKSGGENIYPAEIERVLEVDCGILTAVVVRKADATWGEVPVVFIVKADPNVTEDDVLEICAKRLSGYKRPKAVLFIENDDLPRSTTGKIQRHVLEKRLIG